VQTKLSELQGKKGEGNRLVATPEMAKAIEDFQKQQATMRGERREIRRALREDIDRLENKLLVVNLLATPLLVGVFGIWSSPSTRPTCLPKPGTCSGAGSSCLRCRSCGGWSSSRHRTGGATAPETSSADSFAGWSAYPATWSPSGRI
jgi:hypothetical protein